MRISDWSSDVCSSDLGAGREGQGGGQIGGNLRDVVARRSSLTRHDVRRCLQGHAGASPCPARTGGGLTMATMNMIEAINNAMDVALERDIAVTIFGQDVGYFGGVFRATEGLQAKYEIGRAQV